MTLTKYDILFYGNLFDCLFYCKYDKIYKNGVKSFSIERGAQKNAKT